MVPDPVLIAVLGASAVLCFVMGLWLPAVDGERRVARRLRGFVQAPLAVVDAQIGVARSRPRRGTQSVAKRNLIVRYVERRIADADSAMMPTQLLTGSAVLAVVAFILAVRAFGDPLPGVPAAAAGAALPLKWLGWRRGRKISRFTRQLPDAIGLLSSSVRSGHSLPQALEHVAHDAPEPTRSAFLLVGREIGLGAAQEDALARLEARFPSDDLQLVVASINVQHQIGGSLVKVLDSISETIRERIRIEGDIRALTAPQRMSAYVLCGLPVFVTVGLSLVGGGYMQPLFEPGPLRYALFGAIALVTLGFVVMRALTKIDV
jgi:tight adherence protein B